MKTSEKTTQPLQREDSFRSKFDQLKTSLCFKSLKADEAKHKIDFYELKTLVSEAKSLSKLMHDHNKQTLELQFCLWLCLKFELYTKQNMAFSSKKLLCLECLFWAQARAHQLCTSLGNVSPLIRPVRPYLVSSPA